MIGVLSIVVELTIVIARRQKEKMMNEFIIVDERREVSDGNRGRAKLFIQVA